MSIYTDARSQPGKAPGGSDDRELFMENFGADLLEAWEETNTFESHTFTKSITKGKADVFPIIGRKRDAIEHVPGELILGGDIDHNEVTVTLDNILVDFGLHRRNRRTHCAFRAWHPLRQAACREPLDYLRPPRCHPAHQGLAPGQRPRLADRSPEPELRIPRQHGDRPCPA